MAAWGAVRPPSRHKDPPQNLGLDLVPLNNEDDYFMDDRDDLPSADEEDLEDDELDEIQ